MLQSVDALRRRMTTAAFGLVATSAGDAVVRNNSNQHVRRLPSLSGWSAREFDVAPASALLLITFLLSAALGAVRQMALSARFGASDELSAYLAASRLPETVFTLVAGGALANALVPVLVEREGRGDAAGAWRIAEATLSLLLAVLAGLAVVVFLLAPLLVRTVLAPGFDEDTARLTTVYTRLLLIQPLLLAVASVASASLSARFRFFLPAVTLLTHNLGEIGGVLVAAFVPGVGILGPAVGSLLGIVAQIWLLRSALVRNGAWMRWRWAPRDPGLRAVVRLLIPAGLSAGVTYATGIAEVAAASVAAESQALPIVVNAWLLVGLPVRLIGAAAGQALFPRLALAASGADWQTFAARLRKTLLIVMLATLPGIPAFLLLGDLVTRTLFARGAYSLADAAATSDVAMSFAWGLPFYAISEVATRALVALRDAKSPLLVNIAQSTVRVGLMLGLVDSVGVMIIPWSLAITASLECMALLALVAIRLRRARCAVV